MSLKIAFSRLFSIIAILSFIVLAGCSSPEEKAQAHYLKGVELLTAEQPAQARLEFLNAVKLNDKHSEAWFNLAKIAEDNRN